MSTSTQAPVRPSSVSSAAKTDGADTSSPTARSYSPSRLDLLKLTDPRRQYENIASLYYRSIDGLVELIQNALASILERQESEPGLRGQIKVVVDLSDHEFSVEDNGVGFDDLGDIAANRSTRDLQNGTPYSGFGIGLSSVLARSDEFSVHSVSTVGEMHEARWKEARRALDPSSPRSLEPVDCSGPTPTSEDPCTVVTVRGEDGFEGLWKLVREDAPGLFERLIAHSALGHTSHIWNQSARPRCDFRVIIRGGSEPVNESGRVGFPYVAIGAVDTFDYDRYANDGDLPTKDQLIIYKKQGRKSSVHPHRPRINLYALCVVERKEQFEKRFGGYIESLATNRILVSINGFLQSFALDRPPERRTRSLWGNVLFVLETDENVVEPGRNRVADLYLEAVQGQLRDAISKLDKLATEVRDKEKYTSSLRIDVEKRDAETKASTHPLEYAIGTKLHMVKVPQEEQEVVALFFELLGNGSIPRTDVLRVGGQSAVYDAYFRYRFTWAQVGEGARPNTSEGRRGLDLDKANELVLVGEFKLTAADLVAELLAQKTRKKLDQLDLLVCWDEGAVPADYTLEPLDEDGRFYQAATHVLTRKGAGRQERCEVVVLMDLLERLEAHASAE